MLTRRHEHRFVRTKASREGSYAPRVDCNPGETMLRSPVRSDASRHPRVRAKTLECARVEHDKACVHMRVCMRQELTLVQRVRLPYHSNPMQALTPYNRSSCQCACKSRLPLPTPLGVTAAHHAPPLTSCRGAVRRQSSQPQNMTWRLTHCPLSSLLRVNDIPA